MSLDTRDGLRSGQVAAQAGVNVQTLRYYERRGLLDCEAEPDCPIPFGYLESGHERT